MHVFPEDVSDEFRADIVATGQFDNDVRIRFPLLHHVILFLSSV